jgi:hypothetical protein
MPMHPVVRQQQPADAALLHLRERVGRRRLHPPVLGRSMAVVEHRARTSIVYGSLEYRITGWPQGAGINATAG